MIILIILLIILCLILQIPSKKNNYDDDTNDNADYYKYDQNDNHSKEDLDKKQKENLDLIKINIDRPQITRNTLISEVGGSKAYDSIKLDDENQTSNLVDYNHKYSSYKKKLID